MTVKGAALKAAAEGRFDELPIHNPSIECASRERIEAIQLARLIDQVEWTYNRVAWYRDKMDAMGVKPSDIKTLADVRKLPFTDKNALRETFPYGLFAESLDDIVELHASSGTTGKPIVVGYDRGDMDLWADCIMRLVQMAGVVPSDRVQMAFGYGMFTGGFGLHYGLQRLGCMMIPAGSGNTERQIQMIQDYGSTVLVATPSYAMHVCEVGEKMGVDWEKSTPARRPVRWRALHACSEGRNREPHAYRVHRQLWPDRGHGPGRFGRVPREPRHAAYRRRPLPVGGRRPEDW